MSHRIYPCVDRMQALSLQAELDRPSPNAAGEQLLPGHHTVLIHGELGDQTVNIARCAFAPYAVGNALLERIGV